MKQKIIKEKIILKKKILKNFKIGNLIFYKHMRKHIKMIQKNKLITINKIILFYTN